MRVVAVSDIVELQLLSVDSLFLKLAVFDIQYTIGIT